MAEIAIGTQYEINKQGFSSGMVEPMTQTEVVNGFANIGAWLATEKEFKYFMLLNREAYDFTVFNMQSTNYAKMAKEIEEVLESRGQVVFIEYLHDDECYEIWIKCNEWMKMRTNSEYVMYRFFNCNSWVIEV